MTGGEEEKKKGEGKGFAGLSSLVSDVDTTLPPAAKAELAASAPSTERPAPQAAQPQPSQQHQTYQEPAQPSSSGSSGGKWVLGIAAVVGVLWLIGQSDKSPTSPAPAYSPPAQTATPSYSPPAEPQAPSRSQESLPPVGQDLVFSTDQIRYCLAEDIRLEGAKSTVNNYIDSDVDRFNAMVADYNSRCGSFRYRSGALESVRRNVELYREKLKAEGRSYFVRQSGGIRPESHTSNSWGTQQADNSTGEPIFSAPTAQDYAPANWTWGEFRRRISYHRLSVKNQTKAWSYYRNVVIPIVSDIESKNVQDEQIAFDRLIPAPGVLLPLSGTFTIKSAKANVRFEPSSDNSTAPVVQELFRGEVTAVVGYSADFFKITTSNGNTGFVHRSVGTYAKPIDSSAYDLTPGQSVTTR